MRQTTKENLKNIFGSLISNQRAIEGSKRNPWWVALIMIIIAVILPIIPLMVNTATSYGAQFVEKNTVNYFENNLVYSTMKLKDLGYNFKINDDKQLLMYQNDVDVTETHNSSVDVTPLFSYVNSRTNQYDFQVYFSNRPTTSKTTQSTVSNLIKAIEEKHYLTGTTIVKSELDKEDSTYYRPSLLILYKAGMYVDIVTPNTTTKLVSQGCDWKNSPTNVYLLDRLLGEGYNNADTDIKNQAYCEGVYKNWKTLFNEGYVDTRNQTLLFTSLIFLGIYFGLTIFMGLMIFLLTRGKRNPFNYLSFMACQKICAWSAVSPALLGMILGFMFSQYAVMFFIILLGVRVMWLTMKQLRPSY